jgi:hypothetical protein
MAVPQIALGTSPFNETSELASRNGKGKILISFYVLSHIQESFPRVYCKKN